MANEAKKKFSFKEYFKSVKVEMKKVVWPSKKAVINNTGVVMLVLVAFSICIGALDFVFNALVGLFH